MYVVDHLEKARHALTRCRRNEDDGRVGHVGKVTANVFAHSVHGLAVLFDQIPLVYDDDAGLARVVRETGDLRILLGHALLRVDHDEAHVRAVNGHGRAQHAVTLDHIVDLRLFAHTGGVDKDILALLVFKIRVDGVARRTGNIADDHALGAENAVRERGFANIGLTDEGDLDDVLIFFLFLLGWKVLKAGVEQVARAVAVDGGNGDWVAQSQVVELVKIGVDLTGGVHLIDRQHDRLAAAQQHIGDLLVGSRQAGLHIRQENDDVRVANGDLRLLAHERQNLVVRARFDTAGIHQRKFAAAPLALAVDAVARDARRIFNDGEPLADELIKEHGLAHIGSAHDRNQRFHLSASFIPKRRRNAALIAKQNITNTV